MLPISMQQNMVQTRQTEISIYTDELTKECVVNCGVKITKAFPALGKDFHDIFTEMIEKSGFTNKRLIDAVDHVICTCVYPTPTIAQFISFDKKVKLHTHKDVCDYVNDGGAWDDFEMIKREDRPFWVKRSEAHLIKNMI